ncbi:MAG: hypothetical protein O3A94_07570 [Proteobacteria bacterium]|nr:hypothetical protein [Pseudomonadota bacterium]
MSELPETQLDDDTASSQGGDADLVDLLATLDEDSFIPVAALSVVADILTYLHGRDSDLDAPEGSL